jgi:anti-anti-sigma factor
MALATLVHLTPPAAGLDVSVSAETGATVIALRGEADVATLPVVVDALTRVIADHRGDVVVDLAETEFIDTATLRALLRAREVLDWGGRRLTFRSPSRIAGRVLAVFGLSGDDDRPLAVADRPVPGRDLFRNGPAARHDAARAPDRVAGARPPHARPTEGGRSHQRKRKVRQMGLLVFLLVVFLIALVAGWGFRVARGRR